MTASGEGLRFTQKFSPTGAVCLSSFGARVDFRHIPKVLVVGLHRCERVLLHVNVRKSRQGTRPYLDSRGEWVGVYLGVLSVCAPDGGFWFAFPPVLEPGSSKV
jgi:hypothetical protein